MNCLIRRRIALSCAALALAVTPIAAQTINQNIGGGLGFTFDGGISGNGGGGSGPPIAGALLLEDGISFLLLEDGSSHLCLEGGC